MPIACIVDGRMEQRIVQRLCPNSPVRLMGINGRDVAVAAMAKRAAPLIRLLKNFYPIVVVFDREARPDRCDKLRNDFVAALKENGITRSDIIVGIADRMTENWMLGCGKLREKYSITERTEGCNGKTVITRALHAVGEVYHETTVGVDFFCAIDVASAIANSESFAVFAREMAPHCRWLSNSFNVE